jgi:hypothetical protein
VWRFILDILSFSFSLSLSVPVSVFLWVGGSVGGRAGGRAGGRVRGVGLLGGSLCGFVFVYHRGGDFIRYNGEPGNAFSLVTKQFQHFLP